MEQMNQHTRRLINQATDAIVKFERPPSNISLDEDTELAQAMRRFVPQRTHLSTVTLDDLPINQREGYASPRWSGLVTKALFWCDGKRELWEIAQRLSQERTPLADEDAEGSGGRPHAQPLRFDLLEYFCFLERHGYVRNMA